MKHSDTIKIVTPDWVLDCIDLGKKLAVGDYHPSPSPPTTGESPCNDSHGNSGNVTQGGVTSPEFNGEVETNVRTNQPDKQEVVSSCTSGEVHNVVRLVANVIGSRCCIYTCTVVQTSGAYRCGTEK